MLRIKASQAQLVALDALVLVALEVSDPLGPGSGSQKSIYVQFDGDAHLAEVAQTKRRGELFASPG